MTLFGVVDASVSNYSNKSNLYVDPWTALTNPAVYAGVPTSRKVSKTSLSSSGYNSSRIGFRGTEDLGGGLAASFWLEAGLNNDNGTGAGIGSSTNSTAGLTFNRRSTVSLSGGFGEVRLGRDYVPTFWNHTVFDPFGTNGVGTNLLQTSANSLVPFNAFYRAPTFALGDAASAALAFTRDPEGTASGQNVYASNTIGYFLPANLGGFYGQLQYKFGEKSTYSPAASTPPKTDTRSGRAVSGRFGYANGPVDVAFSYGQQLVASDFYTGMDQKVSDMSLGASYDFGVVKLFGEVSRSKLSVDLKSSLSSVPDTDLTGYLIGITAPVGPGLIRASYSSVKYDFNEPFSLNADPKASKLAVGYVHNLSKRTALYATVARVSNKNYANQTVSSSFVGLNTGYTPKNSTGYDLGIRHSF